MDVPSSSGVSEIVLSTLLSLSGFDGGPVAGIVWLGSAPRVETGLSVMHNQGPKADLLNAVFAVSCLVASSFPFWDPS